MRSSPVHRGRRLSVRQRASWRAHLRRPVSLRAQRLRRVARGTFLIRAALFAARCRHRCRSGSRKPWRERPRCARPTWPRACPEGSLMPWLSLSLQVVGHSMFGGEKRRVFASSSAVDCDSDFPDNPVRFVPENVARNQVAFGACVAASCRPENGGLARVAFDVHCDDREVIAHPALRQRHRPSRRRCCICARHRARRSASLRPRIRAAFGP